MSTADADGKADLSPRGDPPGFVHVVDDHTILIPDRPGNNRLDTMANIVANPNVGCLFFIPGFEDTLRLNGKARITEDAALLAALHGLGQDAQGRHPHQRRGSLHALRQGAEALEAVGRRTTGRTAPRCPPSPASSWTRPAKRAWTKSEAAKADADVEGDYKTGLY